ncbi:hypothetical protein A3842_03265 [Paenibacillus sp. P3E]|nr:hypothetical protein A3842_03265 [Paenibacillus sp. P3E]
MDFRPLLFTDFLIGDRRPRLKSVNKGGRIRSSSSKLPLRYSHLNPGFKNYAFRFAQEST